MNKEISDKLSKKIHSINIVLAILVIMIHCYNIPLTNVNEDTNIILYNSIKFIQNFISQGISRVAVPLFFIISGFLFFRNFSNEKIVYKNKLKKKIKTLIIPYLIWNLVGYIIFLLPNYVPYLNRFIQNNGSNLNLKDFLEGILFFKYNKTFWFMFYLIVLTIVSPIIYKTICKKKRGIITIVTIMVFWFIFSSAINSDIIISLLFYSLGGYLSINYFEVINNNNFLLSKNTTFLITILWFILIIIYHYILHNKIILQISVLIGVVSIWELYNFIKIPSIILKCSKYSFGIYALHPFVLETIEKVIMKILGTDVIAILIDYITAPIITFIIVITVFTIIRKRINTLYKLLNGNR